MRESQYEKWKKDGELEEILILVKGWRRDGAKLGEIADKLGIHVSTLCEYQKKYPEFSEALKKGKVLMDTQVVDSLIKECIGYNYEETTTTTTAVVDKATGEITSLERVETKSTKKYARPSITGIIYYLNNRVPEKWKNKVIMASEVDQNVIDEIEHLVLGDDKGASD